MRNWSNCRGFTMAELLVVVAIIAVLVAIAIPVFSGQLEKSRESTDLANIRSAYAEVMAAAVTDGLDHQSDPIAIKQQVDDWQNESTSQALSSIATSVVGKPRAKGQAWVEFIADDSQVVIYFEAPVPGDQGTIDALNFPEGSNERKILLSLAAAERMALQKYKSENTTGVVGYVVTLDADGNPVLSEGKRDTQQYDSFYYKPNDILSKGYFVAVSCDDNGNPRVGSNLRFDAAKNTVTAVPYHIQNKPQYGKNFIKFLDNNGEFQYGVNSLIY